MSTPPVVPTLDEMRSDWLLPDREEDFSLPALMGPRGMVQAAWGVAGIRNWIHPPTGMASATARLHRREAGRWRPFGERALYRWCAYEIERRSRGVFTTTRLAYPRAAVMQRMHFDVGGTFALAIGGLPRTWRFTDYWNLPEWDVPQRNVRRVENGVVLDDVKTFGAARFALPGRVELFADERAWLAGEPPLASDFERGGFAVAVFDAAPGDDVAWSAVQGCEERLEPLSAAGAEFEDAWEPGRLRWERDWRAAFTPDNDVFGGSLPPPSGPLARLYAMSVLTALCCRRELPRPTPRAAVATGGQCVYNAEARGGAALDVAYVWGGPEGGMTTLFLWELEIAAPLLARLDPGVLRGLIDALLALDLDRAWGLETVSMSGAGMGYGINPGGILSIVADYVRITGDEEFARERAGVLRGFCRPELTDYGAREHVLECVSTYEGKVASFNALNAKGMRFLGELLDDGELVRAADALEAEVVALYAGGPFACLRPDGTRQVVRTALDAIYVGRSIGERLPDDVRRGMIAFVRDELMDGWWMRALSPGDADAATASLPSFQRFRADHQSSGSYDGWPARIASLLARFGERELALTWLARIQGLTYEGPFAQAHAFVAADGGGPRKASFFNGNCAINLAGSAFATTLLEDLA